MDVLLLAGAVNDWMKWFLMVEWMDGWMDELLLDDLIDEWMDELLLDELLVGWMDNSLLEELVDDTVLKEYIWIGCSFEKQYVLQYSELNEIFCAEIYEGYNELTIRLQ